jgi:hypothetical protein
MFRAAKAVLATTALIIAGIGVASPAHAADVTVTGSNAVPTVSPSSISVSSGSTFTVLNSGSDELAIYATGFTPATIDVAGSACVGVSPCTVAIGATVIFTVTAVGTVGVGGGTFTLVAGGGGGSSSSTTSGSAPAPVVQQFGMPATGTCDEAQPEGLNWSGVTNGGWGISWAQWMNGGTGGAVCTRTLIYSTDQSKWVVG